MEKSMHLSKLELSLLSMQHMDLIEFLDFLDFLDLGESRFEKIQLKKYGHHHILI